MIDDGQTDVLNEFPFDWHRIHFDLRRHLIYYRLRHLFQLAQDDVGSLVGEVLLDALVLEMMRSVTSVELRDGSLVMFGVLAVGIVLLLVLLFIEHNSFLTRILFTK